MERIYKIFFKIYSKLDPIVLEIIIPIIDLFRKFKNKPPIPKKEKLAKIDYPFLGSKVIMLHGVSVGEVMSLENLIKKIKENFADYKLVITTGTVTGQELAHKKYDSIADFITYFPLDAYKAVEKFLDKINPSVILIAETELWPNFVYCAKQKNIPTYIINGRISDKSYPSYLKIKGFLKIVLNCFSGIFCQSDIDRERFISLGADKNIVEVMKNLKFEIEKKQADISFGDISKYKIMIAGSTHRGEEEIALETYNKLKKEIENLKLIIAPRHLTRLDEVVEILKGSNFGYRSKNDVFEDKDIIILDTLGELAKVYSFVDIAYIAGSFDKSKTGGHNPLEAAIYSKPTVSGPCIKNFRDIYAILTRAGASFVVKNKQEFLEISKKLLSDENFYDETCSNCLACLNNQKGALDFVINRLNECLKP